MKQWGLFLTLVAMTLSLAAAGWADIAMKITTGPDVLCLVYQRPGLGDQIDITYSHIVPRPQAHRDISALAQASGWVINNGKMTNAVPPVQNKINPMTSVTFEVPNAIQNETHTLPVEPFILAFRSYKTLALIFIVDSSFQFAGVRHYEDSHVNFQLDQHGSAYTYRVNILNAQFDHLNFLGQSQTPQIGTVPLKSHRFPLLTLLGIIGMAIAAGIIVYLIALRTMSPPKISKPPSKMEPQPEKETSLGSRG